MMGTQDLLVSMIEKSGSRKENGRDFELKWLRWGSSERIGYIKGDE